MKTEVQHLQNTHYTNPGTRIHNLALVLWHSSSCKRCFKTTKQISSF